MGNLERAAFYTRRHLEISREVGDLDGINSAEETLLQLETASEAPSSPCHSLLRRRRSMEQLDMTIGQSETSSDSGTSQSKRRNPFSTFFKKNNQSKTRNLNKENEEDMFDILTRVQGSRLDDQRANQKRVQTRKEDIDNLLNQIAGISGSNRRMDKQRVSLAEINRTTDQSQSENKTVNQSQSDSNLQKLKSSKKAKDKKSKNVEKLPDDDFFDSLITCSNRIDEQRSQITPGDQKTKVGPQLRTIPDEDFFKKLLAN